MIGPAELALIAALNFVTIPPMTHSEIVEALYKCDSETVTMTHNMEGKIIKIKCNDNN